MTGQQVAHMENVITRFARAFREKYARGQAEHSGEIWRKPSMLAQAKAEALDLVCYHDCLDEQLALLSAQLRAGSITPLQAAEALDRMRG